MFNNTTYRIIIYPRCSTFFFNEDDDVFMLLLLAKFVILFILLYAEYLRVVVVCNCNISFRRCSKTTAIRLLGLSSTKALPVA